MREMFLYLALLLLSSGILVVSGLHLSDADAKYDGHCSTVASNEEVELRGNKHMSFACTVAFFSYYNFHVQGKLIYNTEDKLCVDVESNEMEIKTRSNNANTILAINRGGCSFDVKSKNAELMGYAGLLVVNDPEDQLEKFPMGSQDPAFRTRIPALMVSKTTIDSILKNANEPVVLRLYLNSAEDFSKSQSVQFWRFYDQQIVQFFGMASILVGCILLIMEGLGMSFIEDPRTAFFLITVIIISFNIAFRMGTYRVLMAGDIIEYHHRETDEKVFEHLVYSVILNPSDYYLDSDTITRLGLSPENYGDSIFIHPPFFVFVSAFLVKYFAFSLPTISILFHICVLLLIPILVNSIVVENEEKEYKSSELLTIKRQSISIWAMIIFSLDPLAFFCSQKFWIDNALIFSVTLSAVLHVLIWNRGQSCTKFVLILKSFMSGLLFGVLVLNCKITGLALLPFGLIWIANTKRNESILSIVFYTWVPYVLGTALGYIPWFALYYQNTGRYIPNSWPSSSMLEKSSFLRKAIAKPSYTYILSLLKYNPIQFIGLIFGLIIAFRFISNLLSSYFQKLMDDTKNKAMQNISIKNGGIFALFVWCFAFIAALSILGSKGSGFQTRFILPIIPATSILAALCIHEAHKKHSSYQVLTTILLVYSSIHCMYYGVMFPNLYADLEENVFDIISNILNYPYHALSSRESMMDVLKYMRHFGLNLLD